MVVLSLVLSMDLKINELALELSQSNPEAMKELKKIMWQGTENWNDLLLERAKKSGKLILSNFSKNAIEKFKMNFGK